MTKVIQITLKSYMRMYQGFHGWYTPEYWRKFVS